MSNIENIYQFAFILLSSVGGSALIIAALSSWLGKVWASRILEADKAKYTKELDLIRHQFEVDLDKLSIIHENQKNSFQRVIKALHSAIKALEHDYDDKWEPINRTHYEKLNKIIIEESLFLGLEGERVLNIFLMILGRTVFHPDNYHISDKFLKNSYEQLTFVAERVREYFRSRIGLSDGFDSLLDVHLLSACILINEYHFSEAQFPTQSILKFEYDRSPFELIELIKENIDVLKKELNRLITHLEAKSSDKRFYFETISEAKQYLRLINKNA